MRKLSTREQMAYRTIATLELERDAALGREKECQRQLGERWKDIYALRNTVESQCERLTVAEKLLKRFDTMFSGGICSGPLQDLAVDVRAALKPAEEGEGS